ncbi:MAG: YtxH domain-containing protein [Dehalococcoidia bacterium]
MRFVLGFLIGMMLGASVGMLLAPQPGAEIRKALRERCRRGSQGEEEI